MYPSGRSHSYRSHHNHLPQNNGSHRETPSETAGRYLNGDRLSDAVRLLISLPDRSNHTTNVEVEFIEYVRRNADSGNIERFISLLDKMHPVNSSFIYQIAYQFIDRYLTRSTDNNNLVDRSNSILRACHGHKILFDRYLWEHMVPHLNHLDFNHKQNFINAYFSRIGGVAENDRTAVTGQRTDRPFEDYQRLLHIGSLHRRDNVLLVGGGRSPIQSQLPEQRVTNYDRFHVHGEQYAGFSLRRRVLSAFRSNQVARRHIHGDFCSQHITRLSAQDHIWCLFSLPMYAQSIEKTKQFFRNAISVMRPGSKLYIFPIGERSPLVSQLNPVYELTSNELAAFDRQVVNGIWGQSSFFSVEGYSETYSYPAPFSSHRRSYTQNDGAIITLNRPSQEALPALESLMRNAEHRATNPGGPSSRNHLSYV